MTTKHMTTYRESIKSLPVKARPDGTQIIWTGISQIDGVTPIMAIASKASDDESGNRKTGDMIQISIAEINRHPVNAFQVDSAVCPASCVHRGDLDGDCYVDWGKSPRSAWAAANRRLARGVAPMTSEERVNAFQGAIVRLGSSGDPCAVPVVVWEQVLTGTAGHSGYTADWEKLSLSGVADRWKNIVMASCGSVNATKVATAYGWRVFAASASAADDMAFADIGVKACPSDTVNLTCDRCRQCDGGEVGPSRFVKLHGNKASRVD